MCCGLRGLSILEVLVWASGEFSTSCDPLITLRGTSCESRPVAPPEFSVWRGGRNDVKFCERV